MENFRKPKTQQLRGSNYLFCKGPMSTIPHFDIRAAGPVSNAFLAAGLASFTLAADFVKRLPYGRNKDKKDLLTVLKDGCGTCSTKHALLKQLADENGASGLRLMLGVFRMNSTNTPKLAALLQHYQLEYVPEAHTYLRWKNEVLDFTHPAATVCHVEEDVLTEMEIQPSQITDFKVSFHQNFLHEWLTQNPHIPYSLAAIWDIREQCIAALARTSND